MQRIVNRIVMATIVAASIAIAGQSFASSKIQCSVTKNGKSTTQSVASAADCTKLGGKVVQPKASSTKAAPKPVAN
jgi:hypothetical protein